MGLNSGIINNASTFLIGLGIAFIVTLWFSLVIWVFRDIRSRSDDMLLRILAVAVSILLFLPGILIYLVLRPTMTTEEKYQASLEEEALLATFEETEVCPGCERKIKTDWIVCPSCHTILKKKCKECGQLMELSWDICPFCSTETAPQKRNQSTTEN